MPDFIIRPQSETNWSNGVSFTSGTLPTSQDMIALGLSYGTSYEIAEIGANATFSFSNVPQSFGTGDWSIADLASGGNARVTITALPAAQGAALSALQAQIAGGGWVDLGGNTTGTYDLTGLFTDGVATNVAIRAVNANGPGAASATKSVTTTGGTGVTFTETAGNEAELETDGAGTITITAPGEYAATQSVIVANLDLGPLYLHPPIVVDDGSPDVGETLNLIPALWIYDAAGPAPVMSYQWYHNGAPIAGATGASYTLQAADAGAMITVAQTADQSGVGSRISTALGITVAGGSGGGFSDDFSGLATGADLTTGPYVYDMVEGNASTTAGEISSNGHAIISDPVGNPERLFARHVGGTFNGAHRAGVTIADLGGNSAFEVNTGVLINWVDGDNFVKAMARDDGRITLEVWVGGSRVTNLNTTASPFGVNDTLEAERSASGTITLRRNGTDVPNLTNITPGGSLPASNMSTGMFWQTTASWDRSGAISNFTCEAL